VVKSLQQIGENITELKIVKLIQFVEQKSNFHKYACFVLQLTHCKCYLLLKLLNKHNANKNYYVVIVNLKFDFICHAEHHIEWVLNKQIFLEVVYFDPRNTPIMSFFREIFFWKFEFFWKFFKFLIKKT